MPLLGNGRKPALRTFVLDNGSSHLKLGWAHDTMRSALNGISRTKNERRNFIADQTEDARDFSQLYFKVPHEAGYLVDFDLQHQIWDYMFKRSKFDVVPSESNIVITEPPNTPAWTQKTTDEVLFEEYGFSAMLRTRGSTLALVGEMVRNPAEVGRYRCAVVVDSGFSFTHVTPYVDGCHVPGATRRIDVGGKHVTNFLKEVVSYRQVNVLEDTLVVNHCKEQLAFVSSDVERDLQRCKKPWPTNSIVREYVLPADGDSKLGTARVPQPPPPQEPGGAADKATSYPTFLTLNHERFTAPELLFRPSNVGIDQCGIPEAIVDSINACSEDVRPHLCRCIVLAGGNTKIEGYVQRIEQEVRQLLPQDHEVNIFAADNPVFAAWLGGAHLAQRADFTNTLQSKEEYLERGTVFNE